ncbi:MAG: hypothetical protein H0V81_11080 [Solirubrobacterales bacterium]|nr:hypothetical protein [Solirubrobacterales bacterium]
MRRRLLALPLATLSALAALTGNAAAQAPISQASCEMGGGTPAICVGLGKLGDRIAAECRRLAIADATCAQAAGRRVIRSEISTFERSPLARTLAFQSQLGDVLGLRDATFAGTHNSFNETAEAPTVSHTDSNQQLDLTDQLRLGMRSLELDVHWLPSPRAAGAFAPVLCHGTGPVGCSTERLLVDRLPEITRWLEDNPRAVILLYLEDQIDDPAGYETSAKVVREAFGERLYTPASPGCTNLPLDLTRNQVRAAGRQVVVVGDCGTGAWQGVSHAWPGSVRFESGPEAYQDYPACGGEKANEARARILRYFEDSTFLSAATGIGSTPDPGLTPERVRQMDRCGTNLLGFDQLVPGDPRLAALAWSWVDGPPAAGDPTCTVRRADGRWESRSCRTRNRPSCLRADGSWFVLDKTTARNPAGRACRRAGGLFRSPRTAFQNQLLSDAAGAGETWIAYRPAPRASRR